MGVEVCWRWKERGHALLSLVGRCDYGQFRCKGLNTSIRQLETIRICH